MIRKNDHSLAELIRVFIQDRRMKPHLFEKKIEQGWKEMMGPWIYKETRSIEVRGDRLVIEVEAAALKQELHFSRDKIRERVNEYLGEDYITEVLIR